MHDNKVINLSSLEPDTEYFIRARAYVLADTYTAWSMPYSFQTTKDIEFYKNHAKDWAVQSKAIVSELDSYLIPEEYRRTGLSSLNILVFGERGSGKSSLINGWSSGLNGEYLEIQKIGCQERSTTKAITKTPLNRSASI